MASSEARVAANRRNAQRSTGPKTEAGKRRSRANALKHGLCGGGIVMAVGDGPAVDAIEAELAEELNPDGAIGEHLVRRAAVLMVRLHRCVEHDHAAAAHRVRHAAADFDDRRADEVAALAARLDADPADAVRRLRRTPGGVDRLIGEWRAVRHEVAGLWKDGCLGPRLADRVGSLLGLQPWDERDAAVEQLQGWCRDLDGEADTRARVIDRVDAEVAALRALRAGVDDGTEAADRAEAGARALFDEGAAGQRARRYEAAAERSLFRALRELREARAGARVVMDAPKPAPVVAAPPPPPPLAPTPAPTTPKAPAPMVPASVWPDWPDRDGLDVPVSIGRVAVPARTTPGLAAQTNLSRRR